MAGSVRIKVPSGQCFSLARKASQAGFASLARNKVAAIAVSYLFIFSFLDLMRHFSFSQNSNDVAVFDQSLWHFLHGKGFYNSLEGMSHLGIHSSPILFLLLPVYALFQSPVTLIVCQVSACALAIVPVFLIAREALGERGGLVFALLFALYHPLQGVAWDLLNELCYAIPFLLFSFYYAVSEAPAAPFRGRRTGGNWMWICLLLALFCKEEVGFTVGFFGLYLFFLGLKHSKKHLMFQGVALFLMGFGWSIFSIEILIPHFRGSAYRYFSVENRYAGFGNSMGSVFFHILTQPFHDLRVILTKEKILYCVELLAPLAFLSLCSPLLLLPAIPSLAANLLSNSAMMSMVGARYPALLIPFIFVSAIYGTRKMVKRSKYPEKTLRKILNTQLAFTILCMLFLNSTPLRLRLLHPWEKGIPVPGFRVPLIDRHAAIVRRFISEIPPGSVVSTQANFTAHFAHGCVVSPVYRGDAQYVLLDPTYEQWYRDFLMTPREIAKKGFRLKKKQDGILLFVRKPGNPSQQREL